MPTEQVNFESIGQMLGGVVGGALLFLALLIGFAILVKFFLRICPPNEVLVVSGSAGKDESGQSRGFRTVLGGRALTIPFFQSVSRMSLTTMEVPIGVRNAYSQGGIAMNVEAIANVKVSSDERVIGNAIERFLNRNTEEIRRVAKETLEGHLRGVVAKLTPEQVNEDRLTFADALAIETEQDLNKLGLHMDTLKILHVSDEVGYLDAIGRSAIATVVRGAQIAESDQKRLAERNASENVGRANTTKANVEAKIMTLENDLRRIKADLQSRIRSEEELTAAAAREARATAEQELQKLRGEVEALRLRCDKVLPADANRQAQEILARGRAAIIRERGRAVSTALGEVNEAWKEAGPHARQISITQNLESILAAAVEGVNKISVDSIRVIDNGDGEAMRNYIASYPKILSTIFTAVDDTVGIDIPGTLKGQGVKN